MKVALVVPEGRRFNQHRSLLKSVLDRRVRPGARVPFQDLEMAPTLGLLVIGSTIDPAAHEVTYLDEEFLTAPERAADLREARYDLVCLTALNNQALRAYELADAFRARGSHVVMGGYHASALPGEAAAHADTVIVGEAEETFPRFFGDWLAGRPERLYRPARQADLAAAPFPRFELLERYRARYNQYILQATRGCPRGCTYCSIVALYGERFRKKPVERVVEEIRALKRFRRNPFVVFADENMFLDRRYSKDLLAAMAPERIVFEAQTDLAIAEDPDLLAALAAAGCRRLLIGLESVGRANLSDLAPWKARRFQRTAAAIARIQSHGLGIQGVFMLGLDHDTPAVFEALKAFIEETGLCETDFSIVTPIPGTALFDEWKAAGRLLHTDWDAYNWEEIDHEPLGMTRRQLAEGFASLTRHFNAPEALARGFRRYKAIRRRAGGVGSP